MEERPIFFAPTPATTVQTGHKIQCSHGQQTVLQEISATESLMKFTSYINVHLSYYEIHVLHFCLIALLLPVCFEGFFQIMKHLPRVPVSRITLFAFIKFQNEWAVRGILKKKCNFYSDNLSKYSLDMTQINKVSRWYHLGMVNQASGSLVSKLFVVCLSWHPSTPSFSFLQSYGYHHWPF